MTDVTDVPPEVDAEDEALAGEVIEETLETGDTERKIRVYDRKGDFIITVPPDCVITFGYFNPTQESGGAFNRDPYQERGGGSHKATAMRIRAKGNKENQLAVFLGVNGFRDESIKLTRLSQRVVIETNMTDDGEGGIEWGGKQKKQLVAAPEPDTYA